MQPRTLYLLAAALFLMLSNTGAHASRSDYSQFWTPTYEHITSYESNSRRFTVKYVHRDQALISFMPCHLCVLRTNYVQRTYFHLLSLSNLKNLPLAAGLWERSAPWCKVCYIPRSANLFPTSPPPPSTGCKQIRRTIATVLLINLGNQTSSDLTPALR